MQRKKYFFSLVVLAVSVFGILPRGTKVSAAGGCCYYSTASPPYSVACSGITCDACGVGSLSNCCDGMPLASTDPRCTSGNIVSEKCCVHGDGDCGEYAQGHGTCSGTVKDGACADYPNDCNGFGTPTGCCVDSSGASPVCESPKADGTCNLGTRKDGACSTYCPTSGPTGASATSIAFINPITSNSISDVLGKVMTALSGLVITLAIIFIVLGGILYMMSAGDPGMITRAKACWLSSVIGLAIVVAAPTFLKEVINVLGGSLKNDTLTSALTFTDIAKNILNLLLSIVGIIAIISLVIAGGMYMTAYGDETQMGKAKKMAGWAVVGIAVALGSLVIVKQVASLITGS